MYGMKITGRASRVTAVPGRQRATCSGPVKASLVFRLRNSEGVPLAVAGVNAAAVPATRFFTFTARDAAGQTPVLEFNFNWEKLSAAAGITFHNFYFRPYPDAIRGPEVIDFLKSLVRHIRRPLLVVWDRLPAHKSALAQEFLGYSEGTVKLSSLAAFSPLAATAKSLILSL